MSNDTTDDRAGWNDEARRRRIDREHCRHRISGAGGRRRQSAGQSQLKMRSARGARPFDCSRPNAGPGAERVRRSTRPACRRGINEPAWPARPSTRPVLPVGSRSASICSATGTRLTRRLLQTGQQRASVLEQHEILVAALPLRDEAFGQLAGAIGAPEARVDFGQSDLGVERLFLAFAPDSPCARAWPRTASRLRRGGRRGGAPWRANRACRCSDQ